MDAQECRKKRRLAGLYPVPIFVRAIEVEARQIDRNAKKAGRNRSRFLAELGAAEGAADKRVAGRGAAVGPAFFRRSSGHKHVHVSCCGRTDPAFLPLRQIARKLPRLAPPNSTALLSRGIREISYKCLTKKRATPSWHYFSASQGAKTSPLADLPRAVLPSVHRSGSSSKHLRRPHPSLPPQGPARATMAPCTSGGVAGARREGHSPSRAGSATPTREARCGSAICGAYWIDFAPSRRAVREFLPRTRTARATIERARLFSPSCAASPRCSGSCAPSRSTTSSDRYFTGGGPDRSRAAAEDVDKRLPPTAEAGHSTHTSPDLRGAVRRCRMGSLCSAAAIVWTPPYRIQSGARLTHRSLSSARLAAARARGRVPRQQL